MMRHIAFRALAVCIVAVGALFCLSFFAPSTAFAQKKSIAVGLIEGPQGPATRKRVLQKLKQSGTYEVTDAEDLRPGADKGAYSAMAQALQVEAIVVGKTTRSLDLTLSVIGPDGNLIEDIKLKGGSGPELEEAIDNELEIALAGPLGAKKAAGKPEKKPPAEEAPEDEEEEEAGGGDEKEADDEEDEESKKKGEEEEEDTGGAPTVDDKKPGRRPLEFTVGVRFYSRNFTYSDYKPLPGSPVGQVYPYKLAIAPAIIASARVYPFAFSRDDALGNIGIQGKLEIGIATSTNYQEPQPPPNPPITYPLNTGTSEWQVGLRGRMPVGPSELGIFGLYGAHSFVLVGDEGTQGTQRRPDPLVPDVNYQFLRFGMDARLRAGKFTVGSHFAARFLTSMKNIDQEYWWFPGATGSGIDFGAFGAFQVLKFMDVAVGVDYIRYGFDFNGIPDDAGLPANTTSQRIAGGATDTFLSGWAGVIFHFDGKAQIEEGAVAVEAKPDEDDEEEKPAKSDKDVEEEEEE